MYVSTTYTWPVVVKTERWTLRVTPAQDAAVRRVLEATGESLNEFVVRNAVQAAQDDLVDRRAFLLDDATWAELQAVLDRPAVPKPELAELLANPSVLEAPGR